MLTALCMQLLVFVTLGQLQRFISTLPLAYQVHMAVLATRPTTILTRRGFEFLVACHLLHRSLPGWLHRVLSQNTVLRLRYHCFMPYNVECLQAKLLQC